MAPSKAVAWPDSIHGDADVLSLDEQGRYVVCCVCSAAIGGKTPEPVTLDTCFSTRAWETHKRRTRAHSRTESARPPRSPVSPPRGLFSLTTSPPRSAQATRLVEQAAVAVRSTVMRQLNEQYSLAAEDAAIDVDGGSRSITAKAEAESVGFLNLLAYAHSDVNGKSPAASHETAVLQEEAAAVQLLSVDSTHRAYGLGNRTGPAAAQVTKEEGGKWVNDHATHLPPTRTGNRPRCARPDASTIRGKTGRSSAQRSATHELYWRTMRELFSRSASAPQSAVKRPRSPNGETDDSSCSSR